MPNNTNSGASSYTQNYQYDAASDYLSGVDYNNNNTYENTWGYDAAGNRVTENYGTAKTSTFDNLNRMATSLSGSKTYTHDKVGNRLTMDQGAQRKTMKWDFTFGE